MAILEYILFSLNLDASYKLCDKIVSLWLLYDLSVSMFFLTTRFFIRNQFIRSLVLDSLKFKKLLELHGKS